jgi:hypothetical protein
MRPWQASRSGQTILVDCEHLNSILDRGGRVEDNRSSQKEMIIDFDRDRARVQINGVAQWWMDVPIIPLREALQRLG